MKEKIIEFISRNKFRFSRGYSYVAMFGMPLLIVDVIQRRFEEAPFVFLFIIGITGIWFIGYIDYKLGILNGEQSYSSSTNKVLMDGLYKNGSQNTSGRNL